MSKTIHFIFTLIIAPMFLLSSCFDGGTNGAKQNGNSSNGKQVFIEYGDTCYYTLANGLLDGDILIKCQNGDEIRGRFVNGLKKGEWEIGKYTRLIFDEHKGDEWKNSDIEKLSSELSSFMYDNGTAYECMGDFYCKNEWESFYEEGYYKNGAKDGEWLKTDKDGKKSKVWYRYNSKEGVMCDSTNTTYSTIVGNETLEDVERFLKECCKEENIGKPTYVEIKKGETQKYEYSYVAEYYRNEKLVLTVSSYDDEGIYITSHKTYYDLKGNKRRKLSKTISNDNGSETNIADLYFDESGRPANEVVYKEKGDEPFSLKVKQFADSVLINGEYHLADSIVGVLSHDTLAIQHFAESKNNIYKYRTKNAVADSLPDIVSRLLQTYNDSVKKYIKQVEVIEN